MKGLSRNQSVGRNEWTMDQGELIQCLRYYDVIGNVIWNVSGYIACNVFLLCFVQCLSVLWVTGASLSEPH